MKPTKKQEDIFNSILHIHTSEYTKTKLRNISSFILWIKSRINILKIILSNLTYFILFGKQISSTGQIPNNKIWLLISSKNNKDSLNFLEPTFSNQSIWISTNTNKYSSQLADVHRLSFHYCIKYWYTYLKNRKRLSTTNPDIAHKILDKIFLATGMYESCLRIVEISQPKAIIFANDHNIKNRALLLAAKQLGIKTIYIQHANVSQSFPPLVFGLSLLEGQNSLDIYRKIAKPTGKVELIGMPKFDSFINKKNKSETLRKIGICTNFHDKANDIITLIKDLESNFPLLAITYRPHPRDDRKLSFPDAINISNSKEESALDFLVKQDAIIAGDSSIHLEAALLHISCLYYKISDTSDFEDYYGFIKNKLLTHANSKEELFEIIKQLVKSRHSIEHQNIAYYNAVSGTPNEGKSSELAIEKIQQYLQI